MRTSLIVLILARAAAFFSIPSIDAGTGPIPLNCDRACLEKVMNQYLAALGSSNPSVNPASARASRA